MIPAVIYNECSSIAYALFIILNTYRNASRLLLFIKTYADPAHSLCANAKSSDKSEYSVSLFCLTALAKATNHWLIYTFIAHIHCVVCRNIPGINVGFKMDSVTNTSNTSSSMKSCVYPSLLRL